MSETETKNELDKIIKKLKDELNTMRIGRASAMIVENIPVEYYGSMVPLKQISTISVPDARMVLINPWAKETLNDVVKAISSANLGANVSNDGSSVKLIFAPPSEERRMDLIKIMRQILEKTKVAVRFLREKKREEIKQKEKNKEMSEDEKFRLEKELQRHIDEASAKVKEIGEAKEKEIMTI